MLVIKITGLDSLKTDLKEEEIELNAALKRAVIDLNTNYLPKTLNKHIRDDVYMRYTPHSNAKEKGNVYQRRMYNGGLIDLAHNLKPLQNKNAIGFEYTPNGNHPMLNRNMTLNGDDLINRIQYKNKHKGFGGRYQWVGADGLRQEIIPKRPFWNNFVSEVEVDGMKKLKTALNNANPNEHITMIVTSKDRINLDKNKL